MVAPYVKQKVESIKETHGARILEIKKSVGDAIKTTFGEFIATLPAKQFHLIIMIDTVKLHETQWIKTGNVFFDKEWQVKRVK